jgi:hypothetical protein
MKRLAYMLLAVAALLMSIDPVIYGIFDCDPEDATPEHSLYSMEKSCSWDDGPRRCPRPAVGEYLCWVEGD